MSSFTTHAYDSIGRISGSFVYMLMCEVETRIYIKIGVSASPYARLHALRTICPVEPEYLAYVHVRSSDHAYTLEKALHRAYKDYTSNGEWFVFSIEDKPKFNEIWKNVFILFDDKTWPLMWQKVSVTELVKEGKRRQGAFRKANAKFFPAWNQARKDCKAGPKSV